MTPTEVRSILALLSGAFPACNVRQETLEAYTLALADVPFAEAKRATLHILRTARFFPTIAEILGPIASEAIDAPLADEAFAQAVDAGEHPQLKYGLHPLVHEAVADIGGWWPILRGDDTTILRGQFVRAYNARLARHHTDVVTGRDTALRAPPPVPELPEATPDPLPLPDHDDLEPSAKALVDRLTVRMERR